MEQKTETKTAVITGASSGIGREIARKLAEEHVQLVLAARRKDRIDALADELTAMGAQVLSVQCDVRDEDSVKHLFAETQARFGSADILIANAGFGYRETIIDGDTKRWKDMLDTNIFGLLLTLKYGAPLLVERGQGDIFLLSSVAGHVVGAGGGVYSASKFAVNAIGEALRQEMARKNVRVTLLAPGVVLSEFQDVAGYAPGFVNNWLGGTPPLETENIAEIVSTVLKLPRHVSLNQMIIRPTGQVNP